MSCLGIIAPCKISVLFHGAYSSILHFVDKNHIYCTTEIFKGHFLLNKNVPWLTRQLLCPRYNEHIKCFSVLFSEDCHEQWCGIHKQWCTACCSWLCKCPRPVPCRLVLDVQVGKYINVPQTQHSTICSHIDY